MLTYSHTKTKTYKYKYKYNINIILLLPTITGKHIGRPQDGRRRLPSHPQVYGSRRG